MWLILILAVAGALGFFGSRWWDRRKNKQSASTMIIDTTPVADSTPPTESPAE